ncbi:hypothetical protein C8F04DRAFT_738407 [Mycena alexandri]|uniref:Transmembrane protein n=1 Tax=Mycena alexandri TaxID=1745969 RepID=A0AAD6SAT9_9AGAR|nr:hypothetical protein C8F04DRAFT_1132409 [Mycena alexandri]KAJ7030111.1 hypothetical protein C8F04DRAFT_738407 [Mycena alexandri]
MANHSLPLIVIYILMMLHACVSIASNYTIDDLEGDSRTGVLPLYEPLNLWNAVVDGNCNICWIHPDPNRTFEHTWHDATQNVGDAPPSVTIQFIGTAIYMFGIVPNTIPGSSTNFNLTFTLDDVLHGGYMHNPDTVNDIEYSVLMFAVADLTNGSHTLVAQAASAPSLFMFDYALYTFNDGVSLSLSKSATTSSLPSSLSLSASLPSSTTVQTTVAQPKAQRHTAVIVAGSLCGVAAAGLLLFALVHLKRRRRQLTEPETGTTIISPYISVASQPDSLTGLPPYVPVDPGSQNPSRFERKRRFGG